MAQRNRVGHKFRTDMSQSLVDYALLLGLVVLGVFGLLTAMGATLQTELFHPIENQMPLSNAPCQVASPECP